MVRISPSDSLITLGAMLSLLFLAGLLLGIGLVVIAAAGVLIMVAAGVAWLNASVVILGTRMKQRWEATSHERPLATAQRRPLRS